MKKVFILFFLLLSCQHAPKLNSPEAHLKAVKSLKEKKQYKKALKTLKEFKKNYPYHSLSKQMTLLKSDIHFDQGDWDLAQKDYKTFRKIYPNTKKDYVLYQLALSFFKKLPKKADRDISFANESLKYFKTLYHSSKKSFYRKEAKKHMQTLQDLMAKKEFIIATFYKKRDLKQASLNRLTNLIKRYPKSSFNPQALFMAWELASEKKKDHFKNLLLKNHPQSPEAQTLKKGSL